MRRPSFRPSAAVRPAPGVLAAWLCALWAATACRSPQDWASRADREVGALLHDVERRTLGDREDTVQFPRAEEEPVGARVPVAPVDGDGPRVGSDEPGPPVAPRSAEASGAAGEPTTVGEAVPAEEDESRAGEEDESEAGEEGAADGARPDDVLRIDLASALAAAFDTSREYRDRHESLYLQGLSLTGTRFAFGPQLAATVSYVWGTSEVGPSSATSAGSFAASQILPAGGVVTFDTSVSTTRTGGPHLGDPDDGRSWSTDAGLSLSQPLLRGSGYEVSHEALTQAERSMVYAIRDFELFRQDHLISILGDYFGLVRQRIQLDNAERDYEAAVFDREKAEALRLVDRGTDEDVFLARRREISAETALLEARTGFTVALDSLRIRLGLPEAESIELEGVEPPFEPVRLDADSAVDVALANRLDLMNRRGRLEDAERAVRIARDGLRTDVDLNLGYGLSGGSGVIGEAGPDVWDASASLVIDVPLQRLPERNAYRSALIFLTQERRDYELVLETIERDIRDALRQLRQFEQQIDLQKEQITQDQRAVEVTRIRVESGDADSRDLLDARQSLFNAQNALISLRVDHFIARLRLYRNLGLLFVDENGMWHI